MNWQSLNITLAAIIAFPLSLTAGDGPGSFQSTRVNKAYVQKLIAERQEKVMSEAELAAALEDINESREGVVGSMTIPYFEEMRLNDVHGLAIKGAVERGLLPESAADWDPMDLDDVAWREGVYEQMKRIADEEMYNRAQPNQLTTDVVDSATAVVESLKARREIAQLQALLDREETPPPPRPQIVHKKFSKMRVYHTKGGDDFHRPEPQPQPVDPREQVEQDLESMPLPDSLAEIVGDLSVDVESGEIQDPQGAEEKAIDEATGALVWIRDHESGHMGDQERNFAERAINSLVADSQPDPDLLNDPSLYLNPSFMRMLDTDPIERIIEDGIRRLRRKDSIYGGEIFLKSAGFESSRAIELIREQTNSSRILEYR